MRNTTPTEVESLDNIAESERGTCVRLRKEIYRFAPLRSEMQILNFTVADVRVGSVI